MTNKTLDIPALAAELTNAVHSTWNPQQQYVALALFRLLAEGEPVTVEALAARVELPRAEVAAFIGELKHRDGEGRVVAFGGLTLQPTSHLLDVDGRTLHAWCALDTLFLPELLAAPARVRSTCPATGQPITLTVDGTGVHHVTPQGAVLSLHSVAGLDPEDVIGTFCCFVHFFATEDAALGWTASRPGTYIASLAEGFEYGRYCNHAQFPAVLGDGPRPAPPATRR